MRSPELPTAATLAVVSLLVLLPTQMRVRNVAILSMIIYAIIVGLTCIVNTIVWAGNVRDVAPIWCDISTNIWFFTQYAVGAGTLCICIQLEQITSFRTAVSPQRHIRFEIVACVVYPIISIPIRYVLSTNRYILLEDMGCSAAIHPSKFAVSFVFGPQLIVAALIVAFAWKAVFNLLHSRYYTDSHVALLRSRFLRLLALCLFIGIWSPAIISLVFHFTLSLATLPWTGRSNLYDNFSHIPLLPMTPQFSAPHKIQKAFYWMCITNMFLIAAILASGEDFRNDCKRAWAFLRRTKASSHPIAVLVTRGSHRSTETVMSEIPSTIVASQYDVGKHHFFDPPSMDPESGASCSESVHGCDS